MYNLGHIYFYGKFIKQNIDKSIELFIQSANQNFYPSKMLPSLAFIKKISQINTQTISEETSKYGNTNTELNQDIFIIILNNKIFEEMYYSRIYNIYETVEFLYDTQKNAVEFLHYMNEIPKKEITKQNSKQKDITEDFYEGLFIHEYYKSNFD